MDTIHDRFIILKIGGSVVTQKNRSELYIRKKLLLRIAKELKDTLKKDKYLKLILIHGAGSAGHQVAKRYKLEKGTGSDAKKWEGALLIRMKNQQLNLQITKIFSEAGLRISPVHTASVIVQKDGCIHTFGNEVIDEALKNDCVPLLYGEMVFDTKQGMSICSGDVSAVYLANLYNAEKILYSSDIDGLYDCDPYKNKDATLIRSVSLKEVLTDKKIDLSSSHNIDVTGGLKNKIISVGKGSISKKLKQIIIFNGFKKGAFKKSLTGKSEGTIIDV